MRTATGSWVGSIVIGLLSGVAVTSLAMIWFVKEYPPPTAVGQQSFGLEDKDILTYMEAIAKIRGSAAFLDASTTREQIVEDSIRQYLNQTDAASDYLNRDQYSKFKKAQDDRYVGIGMEIKKGPEGQILCVPHPESAAAKAGIQIGDELKMINDIPVRGKSVFTIASIARGKPGTKVSFVVGTKTGNDKSIKLSRAAMTLNSVALLELGQIKVIRIYSFTRDTRDKLKQIIRTLEQRNPIVIDLRGNAGGDLHAAIDAAMLFLPKGKRIVSIDSRNQNKSYDSSGGAENETTRLYLWQDESTASAAEVFIAALSENGRATSIGRKSFGKGTVQEILELSDGSALVLTTGHLRTPRGTAYDGEGLAPMRSVAGDTSMYIKAIDELTAIKSTVREAG